MAVKRKQYKVMQIKMNRITDKDGKLVVTEQPKMISNSENLFYDLIYRLQEKSYDSENPENNVFDEFIILKASNLDTSDEENISLYEKIMLNGVWYNGNLYIREGAIKSASMTRTQKTLFIRSDLKDKFDKYSSPFSAR